MLVANGCAAPVIAISLSPHSVVVLSAMLPPPIPQHLLAAANIANVAAVQSAAVAAGVPGPSLPPRNESFSPSFIPNPTRLPCAPSAPSAPSVVAPAGNSPIHASNLDALYYRYDPYTDVREDSKSSEDDDGGITMYDVDLNDRPRAPPPLPPRPSWSPSTTQREQSHNSRASVQPNPPDSSPTSSISVPHYRYVHSSELNRPPTTLDPQQLQARTLTEQAEPLYFRIHNTVLRLQPVAFDDQPEMTNWLNRAKFSSDRLIHDTQGRVLCSLRWLMSEQGHDRFAGMRAMVSEAIKKREQGIQKGVTCDMQY